MAERNDCILPAPGSDCGTDVRLGMYKCLGLAMTELVALRQKSLNADVHSLYSKISPSSFASRINFPPRRRDRASRSAKNVPMKDWDDVVPILAHRTRPGTCL